MGWKEQRSYNNIIRALKNNKKIKVFYTKEYRFLHQKELNLVDIEKIYKENIGYTLSELAKIIKESSVYTNISKTNELKKWLIEHKMLKEKDKKIEIEEPYKDYFIIEKYRGIENIKYKATIINLIASNSIFGYGK